MNSDQDHAGVVTMPLSGLESLNMLSQDHIFSGRRKVRLWKERLFYSGIVLATLATLAILFILLYGIGKDGIHWLNWEFINNLPSRFPSKAGIKVAIWGSVWLGGLTLVISVVLGVGAAIYLEELAEKNFMNRFIEINIATLAGVPSIIYGILGLALFVRFLDFGRSILSGALTMSLLVMPIIIIASREALKGVPNSIRHGAFALGATKWQTVRAHILPAALPGIMTGVILAMARAVGEAAPLILLGALNFITFVPQTPMDSFTSLPVQIYNWASRPQQEFHELAAAGIIVLLAFLMLCNSIAIILRLRYQENKG